MSALLRGIIIGLSIAAPVGPIGLLCIRKTLNQGRRFGFVSGMGAATADALYGTVAALGITVVSKFLVDQAVWLNLIGAIFLFYLAYKTAISPVKNEQDPSRLASGSSYASTYGTTLFLTLTNPLTILSFAGIFSGMNIGNHSGSSLTLVIGVFLGSAAWWLLLSFIVGLVKGMIGLRTLKWINIASSIILLGFGLFSFYHFVGGV